MDRRSVIKKIALSGGLALSSGTLLTLLQSCQVIQGDLTWSPRYFSPSEAQTISVIVNQIIPKDHMPNATDVSVPQFIDLLYSDIYSAEQGKKFTLGLKQFSDQFLQQNNVSFNEALEQTQTAFVHSLYNLDEKNKIIIFELMEKEESLHKNSALYLLYHFLITLRDLTIDSYFTSEKIGEQYLAYDPIPGDFIANFPVDELTKVWSL